MTESSPDSNQHVSAISRERVLVLAAVLVLGIAAVYWYVRSGYTASRIEQQNVALRRGLENEKAISAELKRAELRRLEEENANVTAVQLRLSDLERAEGQLEQLRQELEKWQTTEADLKEGDLGRRVASGEDALKQYQALRTRLALQTTNPIGLQEALDGLRNVLLEAEASPIKGYHPGPRFDNDFHQIRERITSSLADLRTMNSQLAAIIALAPSKPSADAPSLPEALAELENAWGMVQAKKITDEVQKVREEFADKLAAEKAETERLKKELELEKERREREIDMVAERSAIEGLADRKAALEASLAAETRRKALARDFERDLPEIESLLKPFITDGRTQPGKSRFEVSVDVGPVSLAKLTGAGVLIRSVDGQRKLWGITTANKTNDRDLGGFPPYFGGEQDWRNKQPTVGRAQELLIKYGQIMIEKGMLAP